MTVPRYRLEGHGCWVQSAGFSPSGLTLATLDVNGVVIIWNFDR